MPEGRSPDTPGQLLALHPSESPEQYLRELADREAGDLRGVLVVLMRKNGSTVSCATGLSRGEEVYSAAVLSHDIHARVFGYECTNIYDATETEED